ncbi:MAG TPA: ABC transporter ATP-binding protein [Erysipelotrichaceae bacterium]|jgi:ABC-2 type transport system ATP-binding protein|nr:ABC transporter ATP-binding protein [Erysipelotrichia bacterium]HPX32803.1 ABC transporter ATP-binding protein [Erysipelotrichaceae bacterium]HQA85432.1 ABC transporter ATP-binding protein [Erysipelotrichaceae bacterium]
MQLKIENLSKSFGELNVLIDLSYTFEKGKIYALLGKNGSGKTTLFNCISEEMPFDKGNIYLNDEAINHQDVGFVYTIPMLPEFLTGYEFLTFFADIHQEKGLHRDEVNQYFERIDFKEDDRHRLIKDYSTGMKNKLQMLCIILTKPKVLLLDEPLTSLDLIASMNMKKELLKIKDDTIMILSTHILQIAKDISDEIVVLNKGKLIDVDETAENFEQNIMEILQDE